MEKSFLNDQQISQLLQWIGGGGLYKLIVLYRASSSGGVSADAFHNSCDRKGPTITVARTTANIVFGGYTSQPWSKYGAYKCDPNAFLFQLNSAVEYNPVKIDLIDKVGPNAIYDHPQSGPTFGLAPHDLCFWHTNATTFNGESNIDGVADGRTFGAPGLNTTTLAGAKSGWNIREFEVLQVVPVKPSDGKSFGEEAREELLSQVRGFTPSFGSDIGVHCCRIALFGVPGAGKSSLINTIRTAAQNQRGLISVAEVRKGTSTVTTKLTAYQVKDIKTMDVFLMDTMGMEDESYNTGEPGYIMDGNIINNFDLKVKINTSHRDFRQTNNINHMIHCVILVIKASLANDSNCMAKMKSICNYAANRELKVLVALTGIDEVDPRLEDVEGEELKNVSNNSIIQSVINTIHSKLGIQQGFVFPIRNYFREVKSNRTVNILALELLASALGMCDGYFELLSIRHDNEKEEAEREEQYNNNNNNSQGATNRNRNNSTATPRNNI